MTIVSWIAGCSKTEPNVAAPEAKTTEAKTTAGGAEAKPVDYDKICERLVPLAPAERKEDFAKGCVASYKVYLPACRNADAVNACFAKLKNWSERLACMDSCEKNPALATPVAAAPAPASPDPAKK